MKAFEYKQRRAREYFKVLCEAYDMDEDVLHELSDIIGTDEYIVVTVDMFMAKEYEVERTLKQLVKYNYIDAMWKFSNRYDNTALSVVAVRLNGTLFKRKAINKEKRWLLCNNKIAKMYMPIVEETGRLLLADFKEVELR